MEASNQQGLNPAPVEIRDLRKSFGDQKVLDGVNLSVNHGQTVAVLGQSGTGKSVLLKLPVGLQAADSGSIRVAGQEISGLDPVHLNEVRKHRVPFSAGGVV
jgi:phospholipid/cholesterol/gamma-HCH transport system ATP-binding protein